MTRDDDPLLRHLGAALQPGAVEPSLDRVEVVRQQAASAGAPSAPGHTTRHRVLVGLAAAAIAVVAFALGGLASDNPPGPLRELAHRVGLPVRSPELVAAYDELDKRGEALADDDLGAAKVADEAMLDKVQALDGDERAEIVPVAHEVHQRYLEHLSEEYEP